MQHGIERTDRRVDELTDELRAAMAGLGFVPAGAWVTRSATDREVRESVPEADRELLDRLAAGDVSEVWLAADGRSLLAGARFRRDLAWSLVSLLADGTVVRTAIHSAHDATLSGGLISPAGAGYDRAEIVDRPLAELVARHAERLGEIGRARGSPPVELRAEDYPRIEHRTLEIVQRVGMRVIGASIFSIYVAAPITLGSVPIIAWLGGWASSETAVLLALVVLAAWAFVVRTPNVVRRLAQVAAPWIAGDRVPARRLLGR